MDQILGSFEFAFGRTAGRAVGSLIVGLVMFLLVMAVATAVYFVTKRRGGSGMGISFRLGPGKTSGLQVQPALEPSPERDKLLRTLDTVEGYVARFYLLLTYILMAGATGMMAFLYLKYPDDGNRDFMLFYGGVVYIIGMLTLSMQVSKTRERLNPKAEEGNLLSQLRSKINVTVESSPHVQFIDNAALDLAQRRLDAGGSLDEACAVMDARYKSMNSVMKRVFQKAMETALEQRKQNQPEDSAAR